MNIWTSSLGIATAAVLLAGCSNTGDVSTRDAGLSRTAPDTIAVANKAIVIGGPPGYCIDRSASRVRGDSAFVLLASCASITQNPEADAPLAPGLLTASVERRSGNAPPTEAALAQLQDYVASPAGRAALARDGQTASVEIHGTILSDGVLYIHLTDGSANATPGLDETYWRGFFDLNGRLVTISVVGFESIPMPADSGLATMRAFSDRIRRETPALPASVATAPRSTLFSSLFR